MEEIRSDRQQLAQQKYRKVQTHKGLVRFELQVNAESKARFDTLVAAAADEYAEPWDPRRRKALARAQVFDEITQGITHEFFTLKDQIQALKAEIKALSPSFFKQNKVTPLPSAVQALPDEPVQLKQTIANLLREKQTLSKEHHKWREHALRSEKLYAAMSDYNEALKGKLNQHDIPVD